VEAELILVLAQTLNLQGVFRLIYFAEILHLQGRCVSLVDESHNRVLNRSSVGSEGGESIVTHRKVKFVSSPLGENDPQVADLKISIVENTDGAVAIGSRHFVRHETYFGLPKRDPFCAA